MAIGAILGLAGSGITQVFGWLNKKENRKDKALEYAHKEKLWTHERDLMVIQGDLKEAETEQEAFLSNVDGSWDGLQASIKDQTEIAKGSSQWVKNFLSLMRPLLTLIPLVISVWAGVYGFLAMLDMPNSTISALEYVQSSTPLLTLYGLTELTVTWWFGDRAIKRAVENLGAS